MMIVIIKSADTRYMHLFRLLKQKHEVIFTDRLSEIQNCTVLILPMLGLDSFGFIKHTTLDLGKIIDQNPNLKKIYTGKLNPLLQKICKEKKISCQSFLEHEPIFRSELKLKIEALLNIIQENAKKSLSDLQFLVIGDEIFYQHFMKYTAPYTKEVYLYHRILEHTFPNLEKLSQYDVIINIASEQTMKNWNPDQLKTNVIVYELADYPYGCDYDFFKEMKIEHYIIGDVGGRYFPLSSAKVLAEYLDTVL